MVCLYSAETQNAWWFFPCGSSGGVEEDPQAVTHTDQAEYNGYCSAIVVRRRFRRVRAFVEEVGVQQCGVPYKVAYGKRGRGCHSHSGACGVCGAICSHGRGIFFTCLGKGISGVYHECKGEEKLRRVSDFCVAHNLQLASVVTDHYDDLPLIKAADNVYLASPSKETLRKIRQEEGISSCLTLL